MKIYIYLLSIIFIAINLQNCNKVKNKIKNNMQGPNYTYKNAGIDQFYYLTHEVGNATATIPLLKPYTLFRDNSSATWFLDTDLGNLYNELGGGISPLFNFNVNDSMIYGYKSKLIDENNSDFLMPEKWFIINTKGKKLSLFDKQSDFKAELKKLNLPEEMLNPDEVYEQFKNDPILPWFPEDIKKQLEEAKNKK